MDWESLAGFETEIRLSHLAACVLQCEEKQQSYGLKLPGALIQVDQGEIHKHQCLRALALYGE